MQLVILEISPQNRELRKKKDTSEVSDWKPEKGGYNTRIAKAAVITSVAIYANMNCVSFALVVPKIRLIFLKEYLCPPFIANKLSIF
jgi:hypothetical protein